MGSGKGCRKGIVRRNDIYRCLSCDSFVPYPVEKFKVHATVTDGTANAVVVFFDETAEKLVNTTAKALLAAQHSTAPQHLTALPPAISNLIGMTHMMELKSWTFYRVRTFESFNSARVYVPGSTSVGPSDNSDLTTVKGKGKEAMSGKRLMKPYAVPTPVKPTEHAKRKLELDDSDTEATTTVDGAHGVGLPRNPAIRKRLILDSDAEDEVTETMHAARGEDN